MKRIHFLLEFSPFFYVFFNWRFGIRWIDIRIVIFGLTFILNKKERFKIKYIWPSKFLLAATLNFRADLMRPHFQLYITDRVTYIGINGKRISRNKKIRKGDLK